MCLEQRSRSFANGVLGLAVQSLRQDCALRLSSLPPSTGNQDDSDQGLDLYLAHFSNESRTPNFYHQICPKHIKIAKTEQESRKAAFHLQNQPDNNNT